jgi:hypothetical protein
VLNDEDEGEEGKRRREEQIRKDRERFEQLDKQTQEMIKALEPLKNLDTMAADLIQA